ncbi:elongation factor 1-beta [Candidatus Woesearchaeota archaeon CG_4_10_14_0_8_um_filter_47_5]|nr:MAG: elongation factor 1-beta [Candidatus Woesearchaeota archaeon CG_4_10_14_0_8_um_filter_47_5]
MAEVVVTLKVMPDNPNVDLKVLEEKVKLLIENFGGEPAKTEIIPIAFGIQSLNITFVMDENIGSTEPLEEDVSQVKDVASVEVTDVRRAVG